MFTQRYRHPPRFTVITFIIVIFVIITCTHIMQLSSASKYDLMCTFVMYWWIILCMYNHYVNIGKYNRICTRLYHYAHWNSQKLRFVNLNRSFLHNVSIFTLDARSFYIENVWRAFKHLTYWFYTYTEDYLNLLRE